jgi:hypothetical protein
MRQPKQLLALLTLIAGGYSLLLPWSSTASAADILSGRWAWAATCAHGSFHGVMEFVQSGDSFTGRFLETNFWDKGTISNGVLRGKNISFDRTYGLIEQHLSANLFDSNRKLSGPYNSPMFGHCTLSGHKISGAAAAH